MKEFTVTFAKDINGSGPDHFVTFVKKGEKKTVNEITFEKLHKGEKITVGQVTGHGMYSTYSYDKNDLEAEFVETQVIIQTQTRKFRQSKK